MKDFKEIEIKTDSIGNTFVSGYNKYLKDTNNVELVKNHLYQFIRNYESSFSDTPNAYDLNYAFEFTLKFLYEIGEMYPNTSYAQSASKLISLIGEDAVETSVNISELSKLSKF